MREEHPRERHAEESTPEGRRTGQERETSSLEARGAASGARTEGTLTLVCFKCGKEYYFGADGPPEEITCEKCGNRVFRSFFSPSDEDEAARDFEETTHRDLDPDDDATDVRPGDVLDLNRG